MSRAALAAAQNGVRQVTAPAAVGMSVDEIATPALVVDLDAFEANVATLRDFVSRTDVQLRAHAKTHKSADIARYQMQHGGAVGVCCQKVSEAEALVHAGIDNVLVSNQVTDPARIKSLAEMAARATVSVCVDDAATIPVLSEAAAQADQQIGCLVEVDVGAGRCGVAPGDAAVPLAKAISDAPGLTFEGVQAYHGGAQHIRDYGQRRDVLAGVVAETSRTVEALIGAGLACNTVAGAGTGSFAFEAQSGVYTELQCGSYIFMDVDYGAIEDADGAPISTFRNALFLLTGIMSNAKDGQAVCDAGLKVQSVDSGLPRVFGRDDVSYIKCSDEHGVIADPGNVLAINDRLWLVPGHCDPTCNIHDWYVGVRGGRVETLWPVTARGCHF
ncbi:MAG: DSD1 family PLP-dependent enzyme [Pseudomonadota bacterium]